MIDVGKLTAADRDGWQRLFAGYNAFYGRNEVAPAVYNRAWREFTTGSRLHALGASSDGVLVGIAHFFTHPSTTSADVCYLQDLFTDPDVRGRGIGRALIEAVAEWARERDCARLYWLTHESNTTARRLYDQVAVNRGYIQYQVPL